MQLNLLAKVYELMDRYMWEWGIERTDQNVLDYLKFMRAYMASEAPNSLGLAFIDTINTEIARLTLKENSNGTGT